MKWTDVEKLEKENCYWSYDETIRPTGKILTKEQFDYVLEYAKHAAIRTVNFKSFEEAKGKYIILGNYFGGAVFYFRLNDKPEGVYETLIRNKDNYLIGYAKYYENFSYGKYGKIDFADEVDNQ